MKILIGADHRGFELKQWLIPELQRKGYELLDVGALSFDPEDDYVDIGVKLVSEMNELDRGILICGSGHGVEMTANRFSHIRAILGFNLNVVVQGRQHEDANVLCLPADWVDTTEAFQMVVKFLESEFNGEERHVRRLSKLAEIK